LDRAGVYRGKYSGFCFASVFLTCAFPSIASAQEIAPAPEQPATEQIAPKQRALRQRLQPRTENGRQIYDAALFVQYSPQTANDMIGRIPGFNITEASSDRGLGEATQNVLFNGQRISGKSNDARTVLGRTPASTVIRIEIADGAALNIPGLTGQVANVVTKTTGISGNFMYRSQIRKNVNPQYFSAEIGIAGKLGKGDFTLGLKNGDNSYRGGGTGIELTSSADGKLLYSNARINQFSGDTPTLSGSYSRKSEAGSVFNSNAELYYSRERRRQTYARTTPGAADIFDLSTGKGDSKGFEVSADYEFALGGGKLKLVGLQSLSRTTDINGFRREFSDGSTTTASIFDQIYKEGESVARAEYRWKAGIADWQISAEGAYNFLDVQSDLLVLDGTGSFQPEALDNASSRVAEKRGQVIGSYGRPVTKNITLQTQLGAEYSQISQTGARGLTRQFVRPKGLVSLAWKASPRLDISARFERKVGQLNFGDFVASVDLRDANDNAGNVRLVPPQSWLASLEFNRNLKAAGSIKLKLEREWISDIIDQVAIEDADGSIGEAPGNLDSASRWSAEVNATILLDPIGLKGMKFDLSGYLQRGRLRDQLFGFYRPINSERRYTYEVNFRHDIQGSPLAYGIILDDARNAPFLRLNFSSQEGRDIPNLRAYIEHKNILGLKGRLALINILNNKESYRQVFYTERRDGAISQIRNGRQGSGVFVRFSISGTF
jgi:outer membrane receptor for ferrienterochelin and colicins